MANNDHQIFEDIPVKGKNKYHSAILTTFSLDLINFDAKELSTLHRKQLTSVNILVDQKQLNKAMDMVCIDHLYNIGKKYAVNGILSAGAFHPKINLFVGYDCAMVILGTGNLTVPGHGKNHELFTGFMVDSDMKCEGGNYMLIQECWQYVKKFAKKCGKYTSHRICDEIPQNCSVIEGDNFLQKDNYHSLYTIGNNLNAALLYNDDNTSVLTQAFSHIPFDQVKEITVLSPFFDENGETLITLANICENASINVLIQQRCSLPPTKIQNHPRIKFFDFDETERGKNSSLSGVKDYHRRLHAKFIHFKTDDEEYCIVGSANATAAGLGTFDNRGINEEFCVLYSSPTIHFLKEIGISKKKLATINVSSLQRLNDSIVSDGHQIRLISAEYGYKHLSITYNGIKSETKYDLRINQNGTDDISISTILDQAGYKSFDVRLGEKTGICSLYDQEGNQVSNNIIINKTDVLDCTNPSKKNREVNQIISIIENGGYNGLEISEMICDLVKDASTLSGSIEIKHSSSYNNQPKRSDLPNIKYNDIYDKELDNEIEYISQNGPASRLIDCIEDNIKQVIHNLDESRKGEEEQGNAETSHIRSFELSEENVLTRKVIDSLPRRVEGLLSYYNKLCDVRYSALYSSDGIMGKEDFNFFSLTMFVAMEICFLNQDSYKDKDALSDSLAEHTTDLFDRLLKCMVQEGLDSLRRFTSLCLLEKYPDDADESYLEKSYRAVRYALIYAVLVLKKFGTEEIIRYKGPIIDLCIMNLFDYFSSPEIDTLEEELSPISERYNYEFRVKDVLDYVNEVDDKMKNDSSYSFKKGYGWCYYNGKKTIWV